MSEEQMLKFKENVQMYNERNSYVKTVVCKVLGYDENHMYNQLYGDFYDQYLRSNDKLLPYVIEEFQISPMVENLLMNMDNEKRVVFAREILMYINQIVFNFKNEDLESAALMFIYMNNYLRKFMNNVGILAIDKQIDNINEQEYIMKKAL